MSLVECNRIKILQVQTAYTTSEQEKIEQLRAKVENCNELQIGTEDIMMTKFLTFTNWHVEHAYEAIHNYYDFKLLHSTWITKYSVDHFRAQFYEGQCKFILPYLDKNGRAIIVLKMIDCFEKFPNFLQDSIDMDDLIFELLLTMPAVQKNGITIICDFKSVSTKFLRMFTPTFMKIVNYKHDVLPFKMRIMHIIQRGFIMNTALTFLLPLMKKNFKDGLFIHDGKNFTKLREMIGYENLPDEYGGPCENKLDADFTYKILQKNAQYAKNLQNYQKICAAA